MTAAPGECRDKSHRGLTPEEQALWRQATAGVAPLDRNDETILSANDEAAPPPQTREEAKPARKKAVKSALPPLEVGRHAEMDKRLAERFRKGMLPVDGTLDLHGLSAQQAHHQLASFVQGHAARGCRCLLLITGKGGQGVLRESAPRWLGEPPLRAHVLAVAQAQPRHGGSGAYYVLLKRKRKG